MPLKGHRFENRATVYLAIPLGWVIDDNNDTHEALWCLFRVCKVSYVVGMHSWEQETPGLTWMVGKTSAPNRRYRGSLERWRLPSAEVVVTRKNSTQPKAGVGRVEHKCD